MAHWPQQIATKLNPAQDWTKPSRNSENNSGQWSWAVNWCHLIYIYMSCKPMWKVYASLAKLVLACTVHLFVTFPLRHKYTFACMSVKAVCFPQDYTFDPLQWPVSTNKIFPMENNNTYILNTYVDVKLKRRFHYKFQMDVPEKYIRKHKSADWHPLSCHG